MERAPAPPSKRTYYSKREASKLIKKQQASQLSVAKFCELNHLAKSTFNRWLHRQASDTPESNQLPKVITSYRKNKTTSLTPIYNNEEFIPLILPPSSGSTMPVEASLFAEVNGIKIYQRVDAVFLKSLLD